MNFPATLLTLAGLMMVASQSFTKVKAQEGLMCTPCEGQECEMTYGKCHYGKYRNFCGRMECKKGPNQTCGGLFDQRGKCGDGLTCRCGVCTGCSTDTMECYYMHCRPEHKDDLSVLGNRLPFPYNIA